MYLFSYFFPFPLLTLPSFLSFPIPLFLARECFLPPKSCRNSQERGWKCYKCISLVHPCSKRVVKDKDLMDGPILLLLSLAFAGTEHPSSRQPTNQQGEGETPQAAAAYAEGALARSRGLT